MAKCKAGRCYEATDTFMADKWVVNKGDILTCVSREAQKDWIVVNFVRKSDGEKFFHDSVLGNEDVPNLKEI